MATGYLEDLANGEESGEARMIKALLEGACVDILELKELYGCAEGSGKDHEVLGWKVVVRSDLLIAEDDDDLILSFDYDVRWSHCSCGGETYYI